MADSFRNLNNKCASASKKKKFRLISHQCECENFIDNALFSTYHCFCTTYKFHNCACSYELF